MRKTSQYAMEAFAAELEKIALSDAAVSALTLGIPAAALSGYRSYSQAREQGQDMPEALRSAGKGALIGGVGGAGLGAGVATLSKGTGKAIGDFGRRQFHGVTGYTPKGMEPGAYAREIGIGNTAAKNLAAATAHVSEQKARLDAFRSGIEPDSWWSPYRWSPSRLFSKDRGKGIEESLGKATSKLEALKRYQASPVGSKLHAAEETLLQHGVTSIPGMARALAGPNRGEVLKAMGREAWSGSGKLGKGMMGLQIYGDVTRDTDEEGRPVGVGERAGRVAGDVAGMLIPSTIAGVAQMPVGMVLGTAGGAAGRAIDKGISTVSPHILRHKQDVTRPEDSMPQVRGPEVSTSPSAAGKSYGSGMVQ